MKGEKIKDAVKSDYSLALTHHIVPGSCVQRKTNKKETNTNESFRRSSGYAITLVIPSDVT